MDKALLAVVRDIGVRLTASGLTLGVAESCTGGRIADIVTNVPGASKFFAGGVVAYSAETKQKVLGLRSSRLNKYGMVSEETAVSMARGVMRLLGCDVAVAITGNAGPDVLEGREVGLVYLAAAVRDTTEAKGMVFTGGREAVKRQAAVAALEHLRQVLRVWL